MIPRKLIELFYWKLHIYWYTSDGGTILDESAKASERANQAGFDEERAEVAMSEALGQVLRRVEDGAVLEDMATRH